MITTFDKIRTDTKYRPFFKCAKTYDVYVKCGDDVARKEYGVYNKTNRDDTLIPFDSAHPVIVHETLM